MVSSVLSLGKLCEVDVLHAQSARVKLGIYKADTRQLLGPRACCMPLLYYTDLDVFRFAAAPEPLTCNLYMSKSTPRTPSAFGKASSSTSSKRTGEALLSGTEVVARERESSIEGSSARNGA